MSSPATHSSVAGVSSANSGSRSNVLSPPLPMIPPDSIYISCYCEENIYLLAQTFLAEASSRVAPWPWEIYVVFVSNHGKTVALWAQKLRASDVVVWDYHVVLVLRKAANGAHPPTRDSPGDREARGPSPPAHPRCPGAQFRPPASTTGPALQPGEADEGGDLHLAVDHADASAGASAWVYDFDTTLAVPSSWKDYVGRTFPYAFDEELKACIDGRFHSLFRVIPAAVYLDHFASDRSHMVSRRFPASTSPSSVSVPRGAPAPGCFDFHLIRAVLSTVRARGRRLGGLLFPIASGRCGSRAHVAAFVLDRTCSRGGARDQCRGRT
ncbi:N-terminal glutamine amidase-domain-containing protein [Dichomitus squalens]|uniref:Protein N-terminal glutamine amidohydrolase n=1 Tax=Dichomitus squalens TaxID=114155 RepID=A0A4V2K8N7_9APHY|nr:N-terminal glutamine amidase-domain-containing protein [Dichomitus squalens]